MERRRRHAHGAGFPLPLRGRGDSFRRHHHQYPRHGGLFDAAGIFQKLPHVANAALEEIVMGLKVRRDIMPFAPHIDTTMMAKASKLVSNVTGFPVQYNKE